MEQERLWILLGKKLAGIATAEELQELQALLLASGEDASAVEIIERMWVSRKKEEAACDGDAFYNGDAIRHRIDMALAFPAEVSTARRAGPWLIGVAVAGILVTILFGVFWRSGGRNAREAAMQVVSTPKRSHSRLRFPDGTLVVLNEDSRVSYNEDFGRARREIILEGEAYFDVAPNAAVPLVIHAGNVDIKVLGTSFNVKAYPSDKRIETSLISGAVELSSKFAKGQKILLRPNEKITVPAKEGAAAGIPGQGGVIADRGGSRETDSSEGISPGTQPVDKVIDAPAKDTLSYRLQTLQVERTSKLIPEIAWIYRKLVFNQEPFGSVAEKMERWYGVSFYFEDDDLKNEVFTGSFSKETLEEALKALQFSYRFRYIIKKKEVFIKRGSPI